MQDRTLTAGNASSACGCQAASQIMTALAIPVTARLSTSVSPACAMSSPLSTQHITAAPAGTQASSSAPAKAGQVPGTASTTAVTATTLAAIPPQAVRLVRIPLAVATAGVLLTVVFILVSLTVAAARARQQIGRAHV